MLHHLLFPKGLPSHAQIKCERIIHKCDVLKDACTDWIHYCQVQKEMLAKRVFAEQEMAYLNRIKQMNEQWGWEKNFFVENMAFLSKLCDATNHRVLQQQIHESANENYAQLPSVKLTCKDLQIYFKYKCNSKCGVLSPLEFDHHPIAFQSSRAPKRKRLETLLGYGYTLTPSTPFEHAISQLHIDTGLNTSLTNICVFSALSTLCQKKVQIKFTDKKTRALCFSPIFISSSEETREALIAVLNIVYAPLKEYQEGLPYDEEEAKKGYRELDKTQRQRKKLDTASELYSQLSKRIKEFESIPERYNFFITKWSPAKFFKQLQKHPESCCILDTEGNFIRSLLKNTRGTNDMIRFLTSSQTSGNFRYEDEDGQRHDIPMRPVTICSIITKEEYYTLTCRKTKHFKAFVDKMFPIFSDNQWLYGARTAAPPNEYHQRILELIDNVEKTEELQESIPVQNYMHTPEMITFHTSSKIEQDILHTTLEILEGTYNNLSITLPYFDPNYLYKPNRFGNNILYHKEIMHEYDPTNPVVSTAKKINKFLTRTKRHYFRLSALQHDLLSNLRKSQIQAAIDWMIDEGDVQAIQQIPTKARQAVISSRAGQLYVFNLEKASAMERPHALAKVGKAGMHLSNEFRAHQQNLIQPQSSPANYDAEPIPTAPAAAAPIPTTVDETQIIAPDKISNTPAEQSYIEPASTSAEVQMAIETQAEALIVAEDTPEVQSSEHAESDANQQHPQEIAPTSKAPSSANYESPLDAQTQQAQLKPLATEIGSSQPSQTVHHEQMVAIRINSSLPNSSPAEYRQSVSIPMVQQIPREYMGKSILQTISPVQFATFNQEITYIQQVDIPAKQALFLNHPILFEQATSYKQQVNIPESQKIPLYKPGKYKQLVSISPALNRRPHFVKEKMYVQYVTIPTIDYTDLQSTDNYLLETQTPES